MDLLSSYGGDFELEYKHITKLYKDHPEYFNAEFSELGKLKRIGSGGFGTVYRSMYHGGVVAVKRLYADTPKVYKYLVREIRNLRGLNHPNILKFYGVCHRNFRELYLITDLVDGGSLEKMGKKFKGNYLLILDILIYVARGMAYLANINMIHRDLKLGNVLVSKDHLTVKLCDFGLSRSMGDDNAESKHNTAKPPVELIRKLTVVGTMQYMAPEMSGAQKNSERISSKLDVYSFGVMTGELLGVTPKRKEAFDINFFEKKHDKKAPPDLVALVRRCTQDSSRKRPSFVQILASLEQSRRTSFPHAVPLVPDQVLPNRSTIQDTNLTDSTNLTSLTDLTDLSNSTNSLDASMDSIQSSGPRNPAPPPPISAPLPPGNPAEVEKRIRVRRRSSSLGELFDSLDSLPVGVTRKRAQVVCNNRPTTLIFTNTDTDKSKTVDQ